MNDRNPLIELLESIIANAASLRYPHGTKVYTLADAEVPPRKLRQMAADIKAQINERMNELSPYPAYRTNRSARVTDGE